MDSIKNGFYIEWILYKMDFINNMGLTGKQLFPMEMTKAIHSMRGWVRELCASVRAGKGCGFRILVVVKLDSIWQDLDSIDSKLDSMDSIRFGFLLYRMDSIVE